MPRQALVSVDDAVSVIENLIEHFTTDQLPAYSSSVWVEMSKELKNFWTPSAVYTNVRENRRNILTIARQNKNIFVESSLNRHTIIDEEYDDESSFNHTSPDESFSDSSESSNYDTFKVSLSAEEWSRIKPDKNNPNRLKKKVWSNLIANAFYSQYSLPCAFVFDYAYISYSIKTHYLRIKGHCKDLEKCKNTLKGVIKEEPGDNDTIIVEIKTRNTRKEEHINIKRPLNGEEREKISSLLKDRSCTTYRNEVACKTMNDCSSEPPHLFSGNVLRKAKKEFVDKELNISPSDSHDVVKTIEKMFFTPPTFNVIKGVGSVPFYVFYSTEQQLNAYKQYCNIKKKASQICLDATGSVVKKLDRPNNFESGNIFLYAVVINFNNKNLAVSHMLSEKHENEFIAYWLQQWQRSAPTPAQAVCDYSKALLQGLSKAFNDCIIKDYVDKVFEWAKNSKKVKNEKKPVSTFLLVDVAHLIHLTCRWDCFNNKKFKHLKKLFVRCIALMIDCDTVEEFSNIFQLTCIVAGHTYIDTILKTSLVRSPQDALHILENLISDRKKKIRDIVPRDLDVKIEKNKIIYEENNSQTKPESKRIISTTEKWISDLISISKANNGKGKVLNAHYLPDFIDNLKRIAKEFPLWTSIVSIKDDNHKRASSSYVESYFKDLKNRVLEPYNPPLLAHKFLKIHINDLIGASNLFMSDLKQFQIHNNKTSNNKKLTPIVNDSRLPQNKVKNSGKSSTIIDDSQLSEDEVNNNVKSSTIIDDSLLSENEVNNNGMSSTIIDDSLLSDDEVNNNKKFNSNTNNTQLSKDEVDIKYRLCDQSTLNLEDSCKNSYENWRGLGKEIQYDPNIHDISHDHSYSKECDDNNNNNNDNDNTRDDNDNNNSTNNTTHINNYKGLYFKNYPQIKDLNKHLLIDKKVPIFKNGIRCDPEIVNGNSIFVVNTCGVDSILQILSTAALTNNTYKNYLQLSTNPILKFVLKLSNSTIISPEMLNDRAVILSSVFPFECMKQNNVFKVDCFSHIINIYKTIMENEPSVKKVFECENKTCENTPEMQYHLGINLNIFKNNLNNLQKSILFHEKLVKVQCKNKKCKNKGILNSYINRQIMIDMDTRSAQYPNNSFSLKSFPDFLTLGKNEFRLYGVIGHTPGHFIAYCRNSKNWLEYDDMSDSPRVKAEKTIINPVAAIYVIDYHE